MFKKLKTSNVIDMYGSIISYGFCWLFTIYLPSFIGLMKLISKVIIIMSIIAKLKEIKLYKLRNNLRILFAMIWNQTSHCWFFTFWSAYIYFYLLNKLNMGNLVDFRHILRWVSTIKLMCISLKYSILYHLCLNWGHSSIGRSLIAPWMFSNS